MALEACSVVLEEVLLFCWMAACEDWHWPWPWGKLGVVWLGNLHLPQMRGNEHEGWLQPSRLWSKQFLNWLSIPVGTLHIPFGLKVYCHGFPWLGRVLNPCRAMDHRWVSIIFQSLFGYQSKSALNSLSYLYSWSNGNLLDRLLRIPEYCNSCMHLLGYFMQ